MTIVQGWEAQAWQKRPPASPNIPAMSASRKSASDNARILAREDYTVSRSPKGARFFLGKYLCVKAPDGYLEGIIIETEAFGGARDKACHAFGNKRTPRTEILFRWRRGVRLALLWDASSLQYCHRTFGLLLNR